MLRNWRSWVLLVLLVGPILVYIGFGALWLLQHGWLWIAGILWITSGIIFAILAARWTTEQQQVLPPIDWKAPELFTGIDREAWSLVEAEAEAGDDVALEDLTGIDHYFTTGRNLAQKIAYHYHPLSADAIQNVPIVELLTALELAADDLNQLCHQIPGGDMFTPLHWQKAVKVAGYVQRANDIYSYLMPIFSPVTGLVRLGTQHLMVKPAWRNMQQNILRWFFRAYVNRLGMHLIELYSGRLAIGTEHYRHFTRKRSFDTHSAAESLPRLRIAVAGAQDSGKSRLIELLELARSGDLSFIKARLNSEGIDPSSFEHLKSAEWVEIPGYTHELGDDARNTVSRDTAVARAIESDLLILVVDVRRDTTIADAAFAANWDRWYIEHPEAEIPPAFVVLTGMDDPSLGDAWSPPYDWEQGRGPREQLARTKLNALRTTLPPSLIEIVPVGLPESTPFGVVELLLPALIAHFHRAERSALIRHLRRISSRSKARRLASQVGERGRWLWQNLKSRGRTNVTSKD